MSSSLSFRSNVAGVHPAFGATPCARPSRQVALQVVNGVIGPGKRWESYDLNKNGKPIRKPMHVKTGDKVVVIAGADKGKVATVEKVYTKTGEVLLEGVNVTFRHQKPQAQGESGERIEKESPIHHSNVMHWSEEQKVRSRIGIKVDNGKKIRFLKKTGEVLAN